MSLYQTIENDMRQALKAGDAVKLSVLRMVVAAVKTFAIDKNVKEAPEGDVLQILQKQIKQHKESVTQFEQGSRHDLAEKELLELKVLEGYMPKQLGEDEILAIIKAAIAETGASTKADMGKVMKAITEKTRGRADGKLVSTLVTGLLK